MAITRELLANLRYEMDDALSEVGRKHGLVFKTGNATFDADNATFKVTLSTIGEKGEVIDKDAAGFLRMAHLYDMAASDLGKLVHVGSTDYIIKGLRAGRGQNWILGQRADGKSFKLPVATVAAALKRAL